MKKKISRHNIIVLITVAALVIAVSVLAVINHNSGFTPSSDSDFTVVIKNKEVKKYTVDDLEKFPSVTINKKITSGKHEDESGEFTGVPLEVLLSDAVEDWDGKYTEFIFHASDGFVSSIFASDLDTKENVIIVYEKDGKPLTGPEAGGKGPLRIVIANDTFGNRSAYLLSWVELAK